MSEELEKLRSQTVCCGAQADRSQAQGKAIAERAETADQKRENPSALHSCRNVGDLLKEPTLLTDEDVMELLTFIFQSEEVQKKLNLLIENRERNAGSGRGLKPLTETRAQLYTT